MPRSRETNQRIREVQRENILQAARRVFSRKGLNATIDDVAAEAGISHGLAYAYFANKKALFAELVSEDLSAPAAWLEQFAESAGQPVDKIRQMVTGFVESRRENPEHYQFLAQVLNDESAPDDLREHLARRGQMVRGVLRKLIVAGQAAGEVAGGDPDQLVRAILAALEGLTAWYAAGRVDGLAAFSDAEILLRMIKP
jgi:AcrR family transcriptional regulator